MHRKYIFAEVVILLLLSHVGWNGPSTTTISCSREKSRIVRNIIQKKVLPVLSKYRVSLPLDCPFHKQRDVFWWPDEITDSEHNEWTCPACGQKFHCEERLASHWDDTHVTVPDKAYVQTEDAVCLSDFCDIMRCGVMEFRLLKRGWLQKLVPTKELSTSSSKTEDSSSSKIKKHHKRDCNEKHMETLQHKCRAVIRQCIVGLLATLSLKDFQDIEEDLNKAVCFYLSCENLWDDSLQQGGHILLLFCIIVGIILVGGFCLCYYIVWILFDSPPAEEMYYNGLLFGPQRVASQTSDAGDVPYQHYRYHRIPNDVRSSRDAEDRNNHWLPQH
ncbi:uncharacterized protein LOC106478344 [Limulus polyphemus]|uniref:Uncharacterized protein LOC106478344 n=1 Tax=Limulus polyphemus TaxID=6850 RepID=A0ABM1S1Z4_LIMPO|nr:uncharacterized protein LOC106478344 [Limulus polyphemus]